MAEGNCNAASSRASRRLERRCGQWKSELESAHLLFPWAVGHSGIVTHFHGKDNAWPYTGMSQAAARSQCPVEPIDPRPNPYGVSSSDSGDHTECRTSADRPLSFYVTYGTPADILRLLRWGRIVLHDILSILGAGRSCPRTRADQVRASPLRPPIRALYTTQQVPHHDRRREHHRTRCLGQDPQC